jgi:beta-fructofuranosidase
MPATPRIAGPYVNIYRPGGDIFPGPDSEHFRAGQWYGDWVPNDHTFALGPDSRWHVFGITHPAPPSEAYVHEAEWLAFHAIAPPGPLADSLRDGAWDDQPKVLPPGDRPGELPEFYAPFIAERAGVYHVFYGPRDMRLATSPDLYHWTPQGAVFSDDPSTRDPCVLEHDGVYHIVYVAGNALYVRISQDLVHWSDEAVEIFRMTRPGDPESPVLVFRDGWFYLFWCIYDGTNGLYENRTFVMRSESLTGFHEAPVIAELQSHAPELIVAEDGQWYISSVEWPHRGVSLAPLAWTETFDVGGVGSHKCAKARGPEPRSGCRRGSRAPFRRHPDTPSPGSGPFPMVTGLQASLNTGIDLPICS